MTVGHVSVKKLTKKDGTLEAAINLNDIDLIKMIGYIILIHQIISLSCLSNNMKTVDWWVILKPPGSLGDKFLYYDSDL